MVADASFPAPRPCPVCASPEARTLYRFEPARWIPGTVVRCRSCSTLFKRLAPSARPLADYYDAGYAGLEYWDDKPATRAALQPILQAIVSRVPPSTATLLDVGCGPGAFLELAGAAGFRTTGLELNPVLADRARRRTRAEIIVGDIESDVVQGRRFDVITKCWI